ncbi:MAG: outer membrane lipoprotein-sorting protein [Candidatus Bipolaricaulis sp.]|nr:outer membrane lipoprotein-sorting protein [Candidatus Bipolaricaulis sp.]
MRHGLAVVVWLGLALAGVAQGDLSDEDLLRALDDARFFASDVTSVRVRITSQKSDEVNVAELLLQFATFAGESYARITFLSPEELAGQIFLSTPDATYFSGPDLDFPIKTAATTEVFGDAAVAQTSGIRFAEQYAVVERRTEVSEGGELRLVVDLAAIDFTVAFQAATVIVDPLYLRPLSATLYALSGLPFYDVVYAEYATHGEDDVYVRVQQITNRLIAGRVTWSEVVGLDTGPLAAELFDPEALGTTGTP